MIKRILNYLISLLLIHVSIHGQNLDSMKLVLRKASHDTIRCKALLYLAEYSSDDEWIGYNEQLLKLSDRNLKQSKKGTRELRMYQRYYASGLNNVGYLAQIQGDIPKAIEYYGRGLELLDEIGDKHGVATVLNNLGYIYKDQGDIPKAVEHYSRSLKLKEEIGDKRGIAQTLNNLGIVCEEQKEIEKAFEYYLKSLRIREEIGDNYGMPNVLLNIAGLYKLQNNFEKALEYTKKSLRCYEKNGESQGVAYCYHNMGVVYKDQGNFEKSIDYFTKSLLLYESVGDKQGAASVLNAIGVMYYKKKEYAKAIEYGSKSMVISKELGYPLNIQKSADLLQKAYQSIGKYELALTNFELYIKMRDSINNIETQKATIKQQTQYEYDKKKLIEDEKHAAELKIQEEKAKADKNRQNVVIVSVSIVLLVVAFFSVMLYNRFKTTQKQKQIIEVKEKETKQQKYIIEEKQKEILDSINYARRIQYTLLAHDEFLKENLPEHFTYFNPKDIVSGDFYWATKYNDKFYLAVCDSTGHGVPGAFMSLLNIGFLSEAINEKGIEQPNEVFDYVRMKLTNTISKEGQKDGFDGILICMDQTNGAITYAAANNNPVILQNGKLLELEADRMPVGVGERKENFTLYNVEALKGDVLYLYTDGYADQFGGPKGKKFKYKQLNELIEKNSSQPLQEQCELLKTSFDKWRGELEQVDDVCVIGIKL